MFPWIAEWWFGTLAATGPKSRLISLALPGHCDLKQITFRTREFARGALLSDLVQSTTPNGFGSCGLIELNAAFSSPIGQESSGIRLADLPVAL